MSSPASPRRKHAYPKARLPFAERSEQLLDVAEGLFVERGYAGVSVEEIARAAGVSRPVVYHHFTTKEGVYLACVERARATYERELAARVDRRAAPKDQLRAGGESFFGMLEAHPGRWQLLFASNAVLPGQFNAQLGALRFSTIERIAALLRTEAPAMPEPRLQAFAHAISGVGERLGHWWVADPRMTKAAMVDHYVAVLWRGLQEHMDDEAAA